MAIIIAIARYDDLLSCSPYHVYSKFLDFIDILALEINVYVTGFGKTDHIVTIDILRNTGLKYRSRHGSLVLNCSHARFAV